MRQPTAQTEGESHPDRGLAHACILALAQSVLTTGSVAARSTHFLILPKMMPLDYDGTAEWLASLQRPAVLYCFRALGVLVIGSWNARDNIERFNMLRADLESSIQATARQYGQGSQTNFLIEWGGEGVLLSLSETLRWPAEYQFEFCDWHARKATDAERGRGADTVLNFVRPPDELAAMGWGISAKRGH